MTKAFFYNFMPTKAEEEKAAASNTPYRTTRTLIEVRDAIHSCNPQGTPNNPWLHIKKTVVGSDIYFGKLTLSEEEMLELLKHCALSNGNIIISGGKSFTLLDNTDVEQVKYKMSVDLGPQDGFTLGCTDLIRKRNLGPGDLIGLCWDFIEEVFRFKILARANNGGK